MQPDDWLRMINGQIRYYLKMDPDKLDDEAWGRVYMDLVWIREAEARAQNTGSGNR